MNRRWRVTRLHRVRDRIASEGTDMRRRMCIGAGLLRGNRTAWQCALAFLVLSVLSSVVLWTALLSSSGVPPVVVLGTQLSCSKLSLFLHAAVGATLSVLACAALLQPGVRRFIALRAA